MGSEVKLTWRCCIIRKLLSFIIYVLTTSKCICQWPAFRCVRYCMNTEQEYDTCPREFRNKIKWNTKREADRTEKMGGAAEKKILVSIKSSGADKAAICHVDSSYSCEWEFSKRYWTGLSSSSVRQRQWYFTQGVLYEQEHVRISEALSREKMFAPSLMF